MRLDRRALLSSAAHRPWPLPRGPALLGQTWNDLLFAHWEVPPEGVAPLLPRPLVLETRQGRAWVGLTAFLLNGLRLRGWPAVPGLSRFPELNLRTYVRAGGRPGVYFFSLDAGHALAVAGARAAFFLPYYRARIDMKKKGESLTFSCRRAHPGAPAAAFSAAYQPAGPPAKSAPGTIEHWLTERYCFFTVGPGGHLYRGDLHHPPWPLQPASGAVVQNTVASAAGVRLPDRPPLLHYARRLAVAVWAPKRVPRAEAGAA
jgi:hypothetical protein